MELIISLIVAITSLITALGTAFGVTVKIASLHRQIWELKAVLRVHGIWYEIGDPGHPTRSQQMSAKGSEPKVPEPPKESQGP